MFWKTTKLDLICYPPMPDHVARPWDAADEYILERANPEEKTLIFNDRFGALAVNYPEAKLWLESACARIAAEKNLGRNEIASQPDRWITHIEPDTRQILIKAPKDFEQLQFWLHLIQTDCPDARILIAGMSKHIPISWLTWLEAHCAAYTQHPIQRKARLVEVGGPNISDKCIQLDGYHWEELELLATPGVFGRHHIDIGSRFLLETLAEQQLSFSGRLCDLGCGNGLLGFTLKHRHPDLELVMTDDSFQAVESARENSKRNHLDATIVHGDTLLNTPGQFDIIVCNPPFHDGHRQLTNFAQRMFEQSARQLTPGGQLLVVANRHLPYPALLKQQYRRVQVVKQNPKFIVFQCSLAKHTKENTLA